MPDQLRELVSELDRQAQECTKHDTGASGEAIEGLFTLHNQGADYARALRKLQSSIAGMSHVHAFNCPSIVYRRELTFAARMPSRK